MGILIKRDYPAANYLILLCCISLYTFAENSQAQTYLKVATSQDSTCAVDSNSSVSCWGSGADGVHGLRHNRDTRYPTLVPGLNNDVKDICGGSNFFCVQTLSNGVKCWGNNDFGQLGDGSTVTRYYPDWVSGLTSGVQKLACGFQTACIITESGTGKCWGLNNYGQTGIGVYGPGYTSIMTPTAIDSPYSDLTDISPGSDVSCATNSSGIFMCWGRNWSFLTGLGSSTDSTPSPYTLYSSGTAQVSAGNSYVCRRSTTGDIRCRGNNQYGQHGLGNTVGWAYSEVVSISGTSDLSTSVYHTCVALQSGGLSCFGGSFTSYPTSIPDFSSTVDSLDLGTNHRCLVSAGQVKCFGYNYLGQLGIGTDGGSYSSLQTPISGTFRLDGVVTFNGSPLPGVTIMGSDLGSAVTDSLGHYEFTSVPAGTTYNLSPVKPGYIFSTYTSSSQLLSDFSVNFTATASRTKPLIETGKIFSGPQHVCLLSLEGRVICWGLNDTVQLGAPTGYYHNTPHGLYSGVIDLALGNTHSCALKNNGSVLCWGAYTYSQGYNLYGQLGTGRSLPNLEPSLVSGLDSGVTAISSRENTTCAVLSDHSVKCWGEGTEGQIGDGSLVNRPTPTAVASLSGDAMDISVGRFFACALLSDGTVQCWGKNDHGQVTLPASTRVTTPTTVTSLPSNISKIFSGEYHSCAISDTNQLYCWGWNYKGATGNLTSGSASGATLVSSLPTSVADVSIAENSTCALLTTGALYCFGSDTNNLLGDGNTVERYQPFAMAGLGAGVSSVALGKKQACVSMTSGYNFCWGTSSERNLGDLYEHPTATKAMVTVLGGYYKISGTVTLQGQPLSGVRLDSSNLADVLTSVDGSYEFNKVLHSESYILTPVKTGFAFTPPQISGSSLEDRTQNITASSLTFVPVEGATKVAMGEMHGCLLTSSGSVKCWGRDYHGLGIHGYGSKGNFRQSFATPIGLDTGVTDFSISRGSSCAKLATNELLCWGINGGSRLGLGLPFDKYAPVKLGGLEGGVSSFSLGSIHGCAVMLDQTLKCWGDNSTYQVNPILQESYSTPTSYPSLSGIIQVAAGHGHTCALNNSSGVVCWGSNSYGSLGNGSEESSATPVPVTGLSSGVVQITAGYAQSCARLADGTVRCWGSSYLGNGNNSYSLVPTPVVGLSQVTKLAQGEQKACAIVQSGDVYCWGRYTGDGTDVNAVFPHKVVELEEPAIDIDIGIDSTCAVLNSGRVKCWGGNFYKQIGEWPSDRPMVPIPLGYINTSFNGSVTLGSSPLSGVTIFSTELPSITTGTDGLFQMSATSEGEYAIAPWKEGYYFTPPGKQNMYDYLPDTVFTAQAYPGSALTDASKVFVGGNNACLVTTTGTTRCWGHGSNAVNGDSTTTLRSVPVYLPGLAQDNANMSVGSRHACAVLHNGTIKCWGQNNTGQLGNNSTSKKTSPTPVNNISSGATAVATGGSHTCAIVGGTVKCWGSNSSGQLGNGSSSDSLVPVNVEGLGASVKSVCAGNAHSCAITGSGSVYCWGAGSSGQLGEGDSFASDIPHALSSLGSGAVTLACGNDHTCALLSNGSVVCWGKNTLGQCGTATGAPYHGVLPTLKLNSGVSAIAAHKDNSCALKSNGEVWCWGSNDYGQLGNTSKTARYSPEKVLALSATATSIGVGTTHSCARLSSGKVVCWGKNDLGQLGEGALAAVSYLPVNVLRSTGTLQGEVTLNGTGLSGVSVNGGSLGTTTTNSQGRFSFIEVAYSTAYSLTFSKSGMTFSPPTATGTFTGSSNISVTAGYSPHKISGSVLHASKGLSGVVVSCGSLGSSTTASSGSYSINSITHGSSFSCRPSKTGYAFTPSLVKGTLNADAAYSFTATKIDTDKDGIPDLDEATLGTDPKKADTDGDGLSDGQEVQLGLNPKRADTDGDGLSDGKERELGTDPKKADTDGDGLSDGREVLLGLDPKKKDTDGDGIPDGQEVSGGGGGNSNPGGVVCSEWNGFLGGIINIMEHVNLGTSTLSLKTDLFDITGVSQSSYVTSIGAGRQFDLIANSLFGYKLNSYGRLCSVVTKGSADYLDGRMVYYRIGLNGSYEFAFAMPFGAGLVGRQYVQWNTMQPSKKSIDASNLLTNWVQITNLTSSSKQGTVYFYDSAGKALATQKVTLQPGARQDLVGHRAPNAYGLVEWVPSDTSAPVQIRTLRYYYDNPSGAESFDGAFQFEGAHGSSQWQIAPVDTRESSAIVEVSNVLSTTATVELQLYNSAGKLLRKETKTLAAHSTWDFAAELYLRNSQGVVKIKSAAANGVIAYVIQVQRTSDGSLQTLYAIATGQAVGSVLRGSYNTYLGQSCRLLLANPTSTAAKASLSMIRHDKTQLLTGMQVSVPANGLLDYDLCQHEDVSAYGLVMVQPTAPDTLHATVLRIGGNNDYRFPTPVRE